MERFKKSYIILLAVIFPGLVISLIAPWVPRLIEKGYSQVIFRWIIRPYSLVTGLFPFSLAELLLICLMLFGSVKAVLAVRGLVKDPRGFLKTSKKVIPRIAIFLVLIYIGFNLMWGLNYNRLSFAEISGISVEAASVDDLAALALHLTLWANQLRELVSEDDRGVMNLPDGIRDMFVRADQGYQKAAKIYPELGGRFGRPKGVILSRYWSYTGIGGVYFPFTAEANVNIDMPHFRLPATTTHEMAHQRGFAREDEADYISYLTSVMHPDPDFQYSGVMMALNHTMGALYRHDVDAYREIRGLYSPGLNRDMQDWQEYWAQFEGPIQQASTNLNDTYLKANRQVDGVRSYGRMIDLLMAEFQSSKTN